MEFAPAVKTRLKDKYAKFSGRASRSEYWYFILFNYICVYLIRDIMSLFFLLLALIFSEQIFYIAILLYLAFAIFTFIPNIAVSIRRLHDINKSGWFMLTTFIPIFGMDILANL